MFEILVATVITKDNKVLMVKENKKDIAGLLNFPAGHLEKGETIIEGALREVKEETGLEAIITSFIDTQYFSRKDKNYIVFIFQGKLKEDTTSSKNELDFDFYSLDFLYNNKGLLRNENLVFSALSKLDSNKNFIDILNHK